MVKNVPSNAGHFIFSLAVWYPSPPQADSEYPWEHLPVRTRRRWGRRMLCPEAKLNGWEPLYKGLVDKSMVLC